MIKGSRTGTNQDEHIEGTGDVFVTLALVYKGGLNWTHKPWWLNEQYKFRPDAHAFLNHNNKISSVYFEYDAHSEDIPEIVKKMEKYEEYAEDNRDKTFYVIAVFGNTAEKKNANKRVANFLKRVREKGYNPFRYLATTMDLLSEVAVEMKPVLYTYTGHKMSFYDLWAEKKDK